MARRAFAAEAMLETSDRSHSVFTTISKVLVPSENENCRVLAVMLEKKVAMVAMLLYLSLR